MGWLVAALVLAGGAAFLLLGNNGDGNGDQVPTTSAPSGDGKASTPAPPPPPPPPPPPEPPATTAPASTTAPSRPVGQAAAAGDNRGPSGCSGPCTGNADSSLRDALRLRGASARGCYNKALRSNPTLQGKVTVAVRVNPTGGACSANIASDSMGDPSVSSCILQKFRSGAYPKPKGGCVDVQVPLNFVPGGD